LLFKSRRRTSIGFDRFSVVFLLFVLDLFFVRRLVGAFHLYVLRRRFRTSYFGVFRLCGGDKGSALDPQGLLAPRPSPAERRWTRTLRPHFVLAFHFAPLSGFFLFLTSYLLQLIHNFQLKLY